MPLLFINGESRNTETVSLDTLFRDLGLPTPMRLVEYNGTALTRIEWADIVWKEGDRLELLSVATGG